MQNKWSIRQNTWDIMNRMESIQHKQISSIGSMTNKTDDSVHDVKDVIYLTMTWKPKERKVKYTRYGVKNLKAQGLL